MKYFLLASAVLCLNICFSQQRKHTKAELINLLNAKCKEIVGLVKVQSNERSLVSAATFTQTANGVSVKYVSDKQEFTMDFNPRFIQSIEHQSWAASSPISLLLIKLGDALSDEDALCRVYAKQPGNTPILYYSRKVHFNYLKIDPANFSTIKTYLEQLSDVYEEEHNKHMDQYFDMVGRKFWISENSVSKTYDLQNVYSDDCTIYFFYTLQTTTVNGDLKKEYLTVVPIKELSFIGVEQTSFPKGMVMRTTNTWDRFEKDSDGDYVQSGSDRMLPTFIATPDDAQYEKARVFFKKLSAICGGRL